LRTRLSENYSGRAGAADKRTRRQAAGGSSASINPEREDD
jgi:hypothetical protein